MVFKAGLLHVTNDKLDEGATAETIKINLFQNILIIGMAKKILTLYDSCIF